MGKRSRGKRFKEMSEEEAEEILKRKWVRVRLEGESVPKALRRVPDCHAAYASGSSLPLDYFSRRIHSGELLMGLDVFREAEDDPVRFNKDHYIAIRHPRDDSMLLTEGPFNDDEHWIDEIPEHYEGVEVLRAPGKPKKKK